MVKSILSTFQFDIYNGEKGISFYDKKGKLFDFDDCDCTKYSNSKQRLGKIFKIPNKTNSTILLIKFINIKVNVIL